jgi:hypothetical protein
MNFVFIQGLRPFTTCMLFNMCTVYKEKIYLCYQYLVKYALSNFLSFQTLVFKENQVSIVHLILPFSFFLLIIRFFLHFLLFICFFNCLIFYLRFSTKFTGSYTQRNHSKIQIHFFEQDFKIPPTI